MAVSILSCCQEADLQPHHDTKVWRLMSKSAKMDHKKIVYTSGRWLFPQKTKNLDNLNNLDNLFSPKNAKP